MVDFRGTERGGPRGWAHRGAGGEGEGFGEHGGWVVDFGTTTVHRSEARKSGLVDREACGERVGRGEKSRKSSILASLLVHFFAAWVYPNAILERNFASFFEQERKPISE